MPESTRASAQSQLQSVHDNATSQRKAIVGCIACTSQDGRHQFERMSLTSAVEHYFGRSPEEVIQPLHRAVEALGWLGALFECIENVNADGCVSTRNAEHTYALASLGAYIATDYQMSIIGEPAEEMQCCIEAAKEDQV